jgi:DNA-directed RNA polymerase specialized sigma subunit
MKQRGLARLSERERAAAFFAIKAALIDFLRSRDVFLWHERGCRRANDSAEKNLSDLAGRPSGGMKQKIKRRG